MFLALQRCAPDLTASLLSLWHGQMHEAVQYAVRGHDWQRVTMLLGHFLRSLCWQPGEVRIMQQWIEQLPADLFHPTFAQEGEAVAQARVLLAERRSEEESSPASPTHDQVLIDPLSAHEQEMLEVLAQGASNQEIAQALVIAPNTVKRHVQTILAKLGVRNRTQAVTRAQQLDLLAKKLTMLS